jgi:xanthine dehydrogenase accessory factor
MDSVDQEVLSKTVEWLRGGRRVMLATVIQTWGSSPRPVGALAAIRDDGVLVGSVSGGCVEDDLIARNTSPDRPTMPERVSYGVTPDDARRFGLPCGGELVILLEPAPSLPILQSVMEVLNKREKISRDIDLLSGRVSIVTAGDDFTVREEGDRITVTHGPRWRILIIGAAQSSRYLAEIASALDYQVTVCDPRAEYADVWDVANTLLTRAMPDEAVLALSPDQQTVVITLSHDPKLDDMALLEALKSDAFYVGALGSKTTNAARRERLGLFDLTPTQIAKLRGPVGLAIGSRTPPEIAVAILSELIALRNDIVLERKIKNQGAKEPVEKLPIILRTATG